MGQLWRYSTGRKGVNRVTVFERADATSLFVEWWDDLGRHKESLRTSTGHPITDKELAKRIAHRMSEAQEQRRNQSAAELLGMSSNRTLPELLERLHADREGQWSESYRQDQKRARRFWERKLGRITLVKVSAGTVEKVVADEARARERDPKRRNWSKRTQGKFLRYIVDAFYYGRVKLKWITEKDDLSAVTMPRKRSRSRAYSLDEARRLLPALEAVDRRAGWIGYVALQTGRRLSAIRTLRKSAVHVGEGYVVLAFPAGTDKARQSGEAVVTGDAARLTAALMREPGRFVCGVKAPSLDTCRKWIEEAEEAADVPHVDYRAWHGLKRLWATMAREMPGWDKQSGTLSATLSGVYVQDELAPKVEIARRLAEALGES